ncbi:hypothetical protein ACFL1K_01725 [Candidatus Omnitrophota bacterium]
MMKKRSIVLTAIGLLLIIVPISNVFIHFVCYQKIAQPVFVTILLFCISVLSGAGVLLLKEWGRKLAVILSVFGVIVGLGAAFVIPGMVLGHPLGLIITLSGTVYFGLILYYLTRPQVKIQFKKE